MGRTKAGSNGLFKLLESESVGATRPLAAVLDALPFDDRGLLPVITQDVDTQTVLMLAWVNRDAIVETLQGGRACYWSRSRQQLWRKGETSGHVQEIVDVHLDCDGDALLYRVRQVGPACHTHRRSCFYLRVDNDVVQVDAAPLTDQANG